MGKTRRPERRPVITNSWTEAVLQLMLPILAAMGPWAPRWLIATPYSLRLGSAGHSKRLETDLADLGRSWQTENYTFALRESQLSPVFRFHLLSFLDISRMAVHCLGGTGLSFRNPALKGLAFFKRSG